MSADTAIEFHRVSKTFVHGSDRQLLGAYLRGMFSRRTKEVFYALRDVSFSVRRGEGMGVIGSNGAGKSTLLGLASGICPPDEGQVRMNGRTAAVLELGSGFSEMLTGRENLRLNASLLGMTRRRTEDLYSRIVEFSGIGEFINEPLRTYSAGMIMRLAFSVAVHLDPDIVILDEVVAVGDTAFQEKCRVKMRELRSQGKTILCVSHSDVTIRDLCDRAIWLDHGRVAMQGEVPDVVAGYFGRRASSVSES